jgi:hypothetical protein
MVARYWAPSLLFTRKTMVLSEHHQKNIQDNVFSILARGCLPIDISEEL